MNAKRTDKPTTIYEWLCCPDCDSREIVRGPRFEDGSVELRCKDCGTTSCVGL